MLGSDLVAELESRGHKVIAPKHADFDLTDPSSVAQLTIGSFGAIDCVINCAAYTAVDRAESEPDATMALNGLGPGYLAGACKAAGVPLFHVSTDFVFDGEASEPYPVDAPTNPIGIYGATKLQGEHGVLSQGGSVVRTAWLFGPSGPCFPKAILRAHAAGKPLRVVADQLGCPTYTADLAKVLADLAEKNPPPQVFHASGPDAMSWHELAQQTLNIAYGDAAPRVEPIRTEDWPTPAKRPKYSVLQNSFEMPSMSIALPDFIGRLKKSEPELFLA